MSGYPYRPARLVPASMDITKQWYIIFYAWDIGTEKLERKRVLQNEFAELSTLEQRKNLAESIIEEINYFLKHDWHLFSSPAPTVLGVDFKKYSILEALKYAIAQKREVDKISERTLEKYEQVVDTVRDFLQFKKLSASYHLSNLNHAFVVSYFEYIATHRKNSNSTYNFKKGTLTTLINVLIGINPKLFGGINPFNKIKKQKVKVTKHAAFTDHQLQQLIALTDKRKAHQIKLFIQMMYYTLARGVELSGLKVGHINIEQRRILFHIDSAKTIEAYVGISDRLADIINESGVLNYPADYYVFSNDGSKYHGPGLIHVGKNYFYKRITELFEELGFYKINQNHTPYSVKHTGAIALYLATRNINLVQRQCRHLRMETTIKYMRDLGVFTEFEELNKHKGAI